MKPKEEDEKDEDESSDEMIDDNIDSAEFIYTKEVKKEKIKKDSPNGLLF